MKIMAFGDIHEYLHPLAALATPLQEADMVLVTGDMTRWRGPETATKVLQAIMSYNPHVLAQVGNTDSWDIHHHLTQRGMNLHGQGHRFGEVGIFGVGGSNYTPFYTPVEFSEEEIADYLLAGYDMIKEARYKILVAHCPPYQTAIDRIHSGLHVGSHSVRSFIETYQPDLCISGHIHEAPGADTLGHTHLINPGMLAQGGYVTVTCTSETLTAHRVPGHDTRHYSTSPFMPSSL
jgi:Icc-related predicted phosphoesterase